jgi:hypothetical protein
MSNRTRLVSIIILALWSLLRAVLALASIYGTFIFIENAFLPVDDSFLGLWSTATLNIKLGMFLLVIKSIAFFVFAVGIFRGFDWGRRGFIIVSSLFLVWAILQIGKTLFEGFLPSLYPSLDSLIALCIALWYFNKEDILAYFGVEDRYPNWDWVYFKVGKYSVILIIALCLGVYRLLIEGIAFAYSTMMSIRY